MCSTLISKSKNVFKKNKVDINLLFGISRNVKIRSSIENYHRTKYLSLVFVCLFVCKLFVCLFFIIIVVVGVVVF